MKRKTVTRKMRLTVKLDHVGKWTGEQEAVITVGGDGADSSASRGGYIWIGGDRCYGFVGIGKFLRLARNIEAARARLAAPKPKRPTSGKRHATVSRG